MRNFIAAILLAFLLPILGHAAVTPYATQLNTSNSTGTSSIAYWVAPINSGNTDSMYYWDAATKQPKALDLGGFTIVSGVLTAPASAARTPTTRTPAFNTPFQPSTTLAVAVKYTLNIATTASIGSGQRGLIYLEQADDSGFTTNVVTLDKFGNGQTYTLAVAIQGVQNIDGSVGFNYVAAGKYLRLRTSNITGSPSYSSDGGWEIPY